MSSKTCARPKPSAHGWRLEMSASTAAKRLYEAMTIRYASLSDGALARLRGGPISGKRPPPPTSKESLKGRWLRIILARVV